MGRAQTEKEHRIALARGLCEVIHAGQRRESVRRGDKIATAERATASARMEISRRTIQHRHVRRRETNGHRNKADERTANEQYIALPEFVRVVIKSGAR